MWKNNDNEMKKWKWIIMVKWNEGSEMMNDNEDNERK